MGPEVEAEVIRPEDLLLLLKAVRENFVEGESIDVEVSLVNNSSSTIMIEDLTMINNPLHFNAVNSLGKTFSGSLMSPEVRDDTLLPNIREKMTVLLEPKARRVINADLLQILGELPESDYEVKAVYESECTPTVESQPIFFKVSKSSPVYSKTFQDYLRATGNPIPTAWINKEKDGLYLFIMKSSPHSPSNLRSNRRVLRIDEIKKVYPSIMASPIQQTEHLIWTQENTVNVAIIQQRILKEVKTFKLHIPNFQILEPSFTDEDGKLYFLVTSRKKDTTSFHLASFAANGQIETRETFRFDGDLTKYCIIYDLEPSVHIAWSSESGDIFYSRLNLKESVAVESGPKKVATGKPPILDIQLSKACLNHEGRLLLLNFSDYEVPNELHSHSINMESLETISHSFFPLPENRSLVLIQTILDLECRSHYLFQDSAGSLRFKAFRGAELAKVTKEDETYPGNIDCPVLLLSSNMSPNYGIYLRYIKDKSHFVYKKLEPLE